MVKPPGIPDDEEFMPIGLGIMLLLLYDSMLLGFDGPEAHAEAVKQIKKAPAAALTFFMRSPRL
jgi:hypothetical protein